MIGELTKLIVTATEFLAAATKSLRAHDDSEVRYKPENGEPISPAQTQTVPTVPAQTQTAPTGPTKERKARVSRKTEDTAPAAPAVPAVPAVPQTPADPLAGIGGRVSAPEAKKEMTEEESAKQAVTLVRTVVERFKKAKPDGLERARGILISKYKVAKLSDLIHSQRVAVCADMEAELLKEG